MKKIALILMGCGGVGRQLLHHIVSCRSLHANQGVHLRVVGVCDSKSLVVAPDAHPSELDDNFLLEVCRVKGDGSSLSKLSGFGACRVFPDSELTAKVFDIASHLGKSTGLAIVDCSASSETTEILSRVIDLGCCVILANKKPLTSTMEYYDKLVSQPRQMRHESTVGAGLPIIASLNRILSSGDPVHRLVGSLSGTLGYVMSEVEDGKPLSQVVKTAKSLGYTEPDPRDDLGGMDVARKALILARLLGRRITMDSIKVESLYPDEMGPTVMSVDEFVSKGLPLLDKSICERVAKASVSGNVLRYVCVIEGTSRCEVGIQELPRDSPLGRLRGSDNVLEVYTRCYNKQPLVIQGAGAGNDTTAAGVLADILDIQDLFP
ncbi:bifunctional aspartokinase/homoserine dehydrogenase 1 isoform X1 [Rhodamnia argentea]|uniref:Homoserine dehydrogenase n=1 Tax=Rhodamnia argentea TaxID=178133 RepID=A0ABM3HS24_9MYRT|nr:bifunctional aspartokinase/homoserine dehydrogenase 1 isoform X1 [Rhodamnia argentea]